MSVKFGWYVLFVKEHTKTQNKDDKMSSVQYRRPPITEAVIEIRLESPLPEKMVEKIHERLSKRYENSEKIESREIVLDMQSAKIAKPISAKFEGYKLVSGDQADIVQLKPNAMVSSRLAPYKGWDSFEERARADWSSWTKVKKRQKIQRIGLRYINRIDIPCKDDEDLDIQSFLNVFPEYPEPNLLTSFSNYTMQIVGPFVDEGFDLIINTNVVKSPLIDHFSIVLDLDLSPNGQIPQTDDKVWEIINIMRQHKNSAFEMCITDKARELFG